MLDAHGQVGVVASKLNAAQVFRWTGDLPQDVNYAVKSVHLQQLMSRVESQGEAPETVTGEGVEALAPLVQSALVRVSVKY